MKSMFVLVSLVGAAASAAAQECRIEFQRADNMWAAPGRPDGQLGTETLTLKPGETKVFNTDWKYEKRRNDGQNYYGSHVRMLRNTGTLPVKLSMTGSNVQAGGMYTQVIGQRVLGQLEAGKSASQLRADLQEVSCPAGSKEAKAEDGTGGGKTPGGNANPPQQVVVPPPAGLSARQQPSGEIVLNWAPSSEVKEYRVYVDPPPQPQLAGRPAIVSAGRGPGHFVIMVPRNVAPGTVYRASIEALGNNGTISPRASFPPIPVQVAATGGGTGGGAPSTPATSGSADKKCPPGQFVTGISASGALLCAPG